MVPPVITSEAPSGESSWFRLMAFCFLAVVAAALCLGALLVGGSVLWAGAQSVRESETQAQGSAAEAAESEPIDDNLGTGGSFTGVITDSKCGARHSMNSDKTSADCARSCVRHGAHYVLVEGEQVRTLRGKATQVEKVAGERVRVVGRLAGDIIQVKSVVAD